MSALISLNCLAHTVEKLDNRKTLDVKAVEVGRHAH